MHISSLTVIRQLKRIRKLNVSWTNLILQKHQIWKKKLEKLGYKVAY